jgi:hypothetical protein
MVLPYIRCKTPFQDQSVFLLLDWILRYTLFHGFDTLGSHLREEGSLDYNRKLVRLQVQTNFDTIINRQQSPFSGAVAGEQVIKIQSSIAFVNISVFLLIFLLHLLILIILKTNKNQSRVLLNPNFLLVSFFVYIC